MFNTILQAAENFCIHQIRLPHQINDDLIKKEGIQTFIEIEAGSQKYNIYITYDLQFAQRLSLLLLEEDQSDEETLIDMALESTNLIVGSAKVLAQESKDTFSIKTPHLQTVDILTNIKYPYKTLHIENDMMLIGIEAIEC